MKRSSISMKSWRGVENRFGDPESRPKEEILNAVLNFMQQTAGGRYISHVHKYTFIPDEPEVLSQVGTLGEGRVGTYHEVLTIYYS